MPDTLSVPPLRSGGLMLTYRCNQSCRHCNYRSSPAHTRWLPEPTLDAALDRLTAERRLIDLHLAGGEATLNPDLLAQAIRKIQAKKIRISYLETNAHYADSVDAARRVLAPLKKAGLPAVLVSVSPYHNEFIPLRHTLNCLEAAEELFGPDGVFPWLGHFIPMLARLDPDAPHPLEDFLAANDLRPGDPALLRLFPLTPGGRVPRRLRDFFTLRPAEDFRRGHCFDILTDTSHFHIDPDGILFTGHCPGIAAGRVGDDAEWHEAKNLDRHPVFATLAVGGPCALMDRAAETCGFAPDPDGYASPCDLCLQVRLALRKHDPAAWPELAPDTYYS